MTRSLPDRPNLEHLKEQAKDLLKAQRHGDAAGCQALRTLRRFASSTDAEIVAARVTLKEAQFALAIDYGLASWEELRRAVRAQRVSDAATLEAVRLRCDEEIPEYAAGVALAVTAALNHAGVPVDYMTFAAMTGWGFSFGYRYNDISPSCMAVEGHPAGDGPAEVFAFLPRRLGFDYDFAPTQEIDKLWPFVRKHVNAGTPIMGEHFDGGLITGYREHEGKRQVHYDATVMPGWTDADRLQPFGVYVLRKAREPVPWDRLVREAMVRALQKADEGLDALHAYLADVRDPSKTFAECGEWFCWSAFERLMARKCCAVWLGSAARSLPGSAADLARHAAKHYAQAFARYDDYRAEIQAGEPASLGLEERARTPERIAVIAPMLEAGIDAETRGIDALRRAAAAMG